MEAEAELEYGKPVNESLCPNCGCKTISVSRQHDFLYFKRKLTKNNMDDFIHPSQFLYLKDI
jgi:hypothetical protein